VELLHICVRRTLPWHDEAAVAAALVPELRPRVEVWNATFNLRYAAFRLRLTQIARDNLARIENAKLTRLEEAPPGSLVVPVDDDDWFSPEIGSRLLAERDSSLQGYHWNPYILEAPRHRRRWPWARGRLAADTSRYTCGSNNHAIRNLPELTAEILSHVTASRHFDANPRRVKRIDASLSLQNRNLGSRSTLHWIAPELTRGGLIQTFRRYRTLYDRLRLPREFVWAKPSVLAMAELMRELRLR